MYGELEYRSVRRDLLTDACSRRSWPDSSIVQNGASAAPHRQAAHDMTPVMLVWGALPL